MDTVSQGGVRLAYFAVVFAVMAGWEHFAPRRASSATRRQRWPGNLLLALSGAVLVRIVSPIGAVGIALFAESGGWGLSPLLSIPTHTAAVLSFVLLDLAVYLQHRAFHAVGPLWHLHRVHHADKDIDVTTGARFHPVEILISLGVKGLVIVALGAPAASVMVFEILLNATAMFNHANARIPLALDRLLRLVVVTPDMHRVHHSIHPIETGRNFGFNLPFWDRFFGTYTEQPKAGHEDMVIGLPQFIDEPRTARLMWMLTSPLAGK